MKVVGYQPYEPAVFTPSDISTLTEVFPYPD